MRHTHTHAHARTRTQKHANKPNQKKRLIAPVKLNGVEVASPDKSYIKGFCKFKKSVRVEKLSKEMFGDELYLPGPELLANEGKEYTGYQKGVSFGEGVIEDSVLDPKTGALIHKKYVLVRDWMNND